MSPYPASKGGLLSGTWLTDRINLFFRLRRYIKWVAERWFILVFCVVAGLGFATYRAIRTPNMFRATSKIGVTPKILTPHQTQAEYREEMSTFFEKQVQYMTSDHVLSKVWQKIGETNSISKKEGFDVNQRNAAGYTALMIASSNNNLAAVQALLRAGADPKLKDYSGKTARNIAKKAKAKAIEKILKKAEKGKFK